MKPGKYISSRCGWLASYAILAAFAAPAAAQHGGIVNLDESGPLPHSDQDGCGGPDTIRIGNGREGECKILYVDSNATGANTGYCWRDALTDLCEALDIVANDPNFCEIWVADGSYTSDCGSGMNGAFSIPDGVTVLGGFTGNEALRSQRNPDPHTNNTVLNGAAPIGERTPTLGGRPPATHVVAMVNASRRTMLSGFTIVGGAAADSGAAYGDRGGGVLIVGGAPRIRDCIIRDCTADYAGGGVYISGGEPLLRNVSFEYNAAAFGGALMADGQSIATLIHCDFIGNTAIESGGAALFDGDAVAYVYRSRMQGNGARNGGGLAAIGASYVEMANVLLSGNTADSAGALLVQEGGYAALSNLTLVANDAISAGGVRAEGAGRVQAINTILWANTDESGAGESAQVQLHDTASARFDYCCIAGWTGALPGVSVIDADPLFVTQAGGGALDLRIGSGSPCIDAGTSPLTFRVFGRKPQDLDGRPRFVDDPLTPDTGEGGEPVIDIGAYEYQATASGGAP